MTDETALLKRIGLAVRLERVARGLSQNDLAAAAGISRVTLGSIERGDHPASIVAFARSTGLSLDRIMNGQSNIALTLLVTVRPRSRPGWRLRRSMDNDLQRGTIVLTTTERR